MRYQANWYRDDSRVKIWEKSRRIGASWADACMSVEDAAKVKGCNTFYIGYNREMAEQYIEDCSYWARAFNVVAQRLGTEIIQDNEKSIQVYRLKFQTGFKVVALSSRPSNLRAKKGKVVIDEAAFHPDLAELLKAAMAILAWGGQVRMISTHNGIDNLFNEMVQDIRDGNLKYSLHRTTLDEALADGLYERICLVNERAYSLEAEQVWRDELWEDYGYGAMEELGCQPMVVSGGIIELDWINRYDIPPSRFTRITQSWDTASKKKEASANWSGTTWGELNGDKYLLDVYTKKHTYPEGRRVVRSVADKWQPDEILIEDKDSGIHLIQEFREDEDFPYPVLAIEPEGDKVTRFSVESTAYQGREVWHPNRAKWLPEFEAALTSFPKGAIDPVDSTSQYLHWIKNQSRRARRSARSGEKRSYDFLGQGSGRRA